MLLGTVVNIGYSVLFKTGEHLENLVPPAVKTQPLRLRAFACDLFWGTQRREDAKKHFTDKGMLELWAKSTLDLFRFCFITEGRFLRVLCPFVVNNGLRAKPTSASFLFFSFFFVLFVSAW